MLYKITNYTIIQDICLESDLMEYEIAIKEYNIILIQATRGLRPFPQLLNELDEVVE